MKRILSFILAVALIVTLLPALPAQAATSGTTGSCKWTLNGTELTISGNGAMGNQSSSSLPWGKNITKVTIQSGVTVIGAYSFYGCTALTSVSIPSTVTEVGSYAFKNCTSLKSISIPNSVTMIGNETFYGCSALTSVSIGTGLKTIVASVFMRCDSLSTITVNSGNSRLMAKGNCIIDKSTGKLIVGCKNSVIPTDGSVTTIGNSAFRQVTGLSSISIPASVTKIDEYAFANSGIKSVTLNSGLTSIGLRAFSVCDIQSIHLPDTLKTIGNYAFTATDLRSVDIPDSVTSIGSSAFYNCSSLTSVDLGDGLQTIGDNAFSGTGLRSVVVPDSATSIGASAFYNVSSLTSVDLGNGLQTIGDYVFSGTGLRSVVIPDSVTNLGTHAFTNCSNLSSITIGAGISSIRPEAFMGCPRQILKVSPNSPYYYSVDDSAIIEKSTDTLVLGNQYGAVPAQAKMIGCYAFSECNGLKSIKIPDNIEFIDSFAFYNCTELTTVEIAGSVKVIGDYAFGKCTALTNLTLHEGIFDIEEGAFQYCGKLDDVDLPNSITSINGCAFEGTGMYNNPANWDKAAGSTGCTGVFYVDDCLVFNDGTAVDKIYEIRPGTRLIANEALRSQTFAQVIMPDSLTYIMDYAFLYCTYLEEVEIPDNVVHIGYGAFSDCERLRKVKLGEKLKYIGTSAFSNTRSLERIEISPNNPNYTSKDGILFTKHMSGVVIQPAAQRLQLTIRYVNEAGEELAPAEVFLLHDGFYDYPVPSIRGYYTESANVSGRITEDTTLDVVYLEGAVIASGQWGNLKWVLFEDGLLFVDGEGVMKGGTYPWSEYAAQILSVYIGPGVTCVNERAFQDCANLTSVEITGGATLIMESAFQNCTALTELTLHEGIQTLQSMAFGNCTALTDITLPDSVMKINTRTFYNTGYYNDAANWDDAGVLYIGKHLVSVKNSLSGSYEIRPGTTVIAGEVFHGQTKLTQVVWPEGLRYIGYAAFHSTSLTEVVLPDSVEEIEELAFGNGLKLVDAKLGKNLQRIHEWAFHSSLKLERIEISKDNPNFASKDGILYKKDMSRAIITPDARKVELTIRYLDLMDNEVAPPQVFRYAVGTDYDIPNPEIPGFHTDSTGVVGTITQDAVVDVVYLEMSVNDNGTWDNIRWVLYEDGTLVLKGKGAMPEGTAPWLSDPTRIVEIYLDSRITGISAGAFQNCVNLTLVEFGYGITKIGNNAFAGCTNLKKLYLPDTVTAIGNGAFSGCTGLTALVLPDSVVSIGDKGFADCTGLEKVTLGAAVETVGNNAFNGCANLTQVYFRGQPADLGATSFGTAQGKFVYYYTSVAGWEDAVVDGLWRGYTAVPYQAIAREDFTGTNIYILKVVDRHNTPLTGAVVQLGDQIQSANADGMVYFIRPTSAVKLEVSCSGHISLKDESYVVYPGRVIDYIELSDSPTTVQGIRCDDQSIVTSVYEFNCNSEETVELTVQGDSKYEIVSYELLQGNRILATEKTNAKQITFRLPANAFEEGDTVLVRLSTADGSVVSSALNLRPLWIAPLSNQKILDELEKVDLWLDAGAFGKISLPLYFNGGDERIYVSVAGSTIRVGLNIDITELMDKDEAGSITRVEKEIRKKMKTMAKPDSGFNCEVAGYIELEYMGNDQYYVKTSYVKVAVGAELSFKAQASFLGIVGVYFKASLSATGSLELSISRYTPEEGFVLADTTVGLEDQLGIEGGAFLLWGAGSAGIYGHLNMGFTVGIVPSWELESVYISGELGIKWSAFWGWFTGRHTIVDGDLYRWPSVRAYARALMRSAPAGSMTFNDRQYLENRGPWQSGDSLLTGLADHTAPQVVTCGDTTVMVWLDDNPSRDSSNYQTLYYSVYNPATDSWSAPAQVDNNETFDCEFCLYTDNQEIYVLYTEQKNVLSGLDQMDFEDAQAMAALIGGVEVSFTRFHGDGFDAPVRLTDNGLCETLPVLTGRTDDLLALWTVADSVNGTAQAEKSHVYGARYTGDGWSQGTPYTGNQNGIYDLIGLSMDGTDYLAFLLDGDNDPQTDDDMLLILSDGSTARQVAQGRIDDVSVGQIGGAEYLLWNQDGCVYALRGLNGQAVALLPEEVQANSAYRLLDISPDATLLTYAVGNEIWGIQVQESGWLHSPVLLLRRDGVVSRYDAAMVDEQLLLTFTETTATITADTVQTETLLDYAFYAFHTDVSLEAADFDITQALPSQPLEITLTLSNEGLTDVNAVTVNLYDPMGALVATGEYVLSVKQGQSATLTAILILPDSIQEGNYALEVVPADATDSLPQNNRISIVPGYSDLAVTARQTIIGGRNYLAIQVENAGNLPSDAQLLVYDRDGNRIGQLDVSALAAGGQNHYLMDVDAFTDKERNLVKCQVMAQNLDPFGLNDTCTLTLFYTDEDDFQQNPEDFEENPTLSAYSAVYDRHTGGSICFEILSGGDQFTGIEGFSGWSRSDNIITLEANALQTLPLGRQVLTIQFGNQTRSFTVDVIDTTPVLLSGVVGILGQAITGTTVYADLSGMEPQNATVVYVWTVDGAVVSQSASYTIQTEDAGKNLLLMVAGVDGYTGSLSTSVDVTLRQPAPPLKPVVMQVTPTGVTLAGADGVEYSLDGESWQTSPIFADLQINKTYTFYARYAATADSAASDPSAGVTVTTPKYTANAPEAPVAEQITDVSVTLRAVTGGLYSLDGENWQESPVFAGLDANVTYTFYQKLAENDTTMESPVSNGLTVTTLKHTAPRPPMPTVTRRSATTLSLTFVPGYEYSLDGVNWQNPSSGLWHNHSSFTGLSPNTEYTFYQRVAETEDTYASQPSEPLVARTWKHTAGAPTAPTVAEVTSNSITLTAEPGYEYKLLTSYNEYAVVVPVSPGIWGTEQEPVTDNEGWQTSAVFEGLQPNRIYYLFRRTAETDTSYASWESKCLKVRTLKETAPIPAAPEIVQVQWDSVELAYEEGYQYRMEGGDWQDSPIFTGLKPNRTYTFYCKTVETDTMLESDSSAGTTVTTLKQTQPQPTPPVVVAVTHDSITLEYNDLYIYRLEGRIWQTSPTFTGLEPNKQYAVYRMLRATSEAYESPESEPLMVTTLKAPAPVPAAPEIHYMEWSTIILEEQPGYQYRIEGGDWQDSGVFIGLEPNQTYVFYCRTVETDTMLTSESSAGTAVTTPKRPVPAPAAPEAYMIQWDTIILVAQPGYQYRMEGGDWQDSPEFGGLLPNRSYTFYCRTAETDIFMASESSAGTTLTTLPRYELDGELTIQGNPCYQNTLQAVYSDPDATLDYQWYVGGVLVEGAVNASYIVTREDIGKTIMVVITGTGLYAGTMSCEVTYPAYLPGDVTGDGKVNMRDWNKLYEAITEVTELTEDGYLRADVTGDGKVNMKDWNRLYEHINEINPLW